MTLLRFCTSLDSNCFTSILPWISQNRAMIQNWDQANGDLSGTVSLI